MKPSARNNRAFLVASMLLVAISLARAAPPNDAGSMTSYGFSASAGTFTPLAGGTRAFDVEVNDASSDALPLGFTFWYLGVPCTQVWANSNGFLSFNPAAAAATTSNMRTNSPAAGSATLRPMVAPLWDDLSGAGTGVASYATSGAPGARVFTFEWLNWKWNAAATDAGISFQARLYEATGAVEFLYRQEAGAVNFGSASICIAATDTGSGNFLSLQDTGTLPVVSSTTEETSLATRPGTGQMYAFTPPAVVPAAPTGLGFIGVTQTAMTLSWTDAATTEAGYTILRSTDGVSFNFATTLAAGSTSYAVSNLAPGTTYFWRVHAVTEGRASAALSGSQATAAAGAVACAGAGGNWSAGATWSGGVLPAATDNVTITNGCTVTIDTSATINKLTVGQGASGILQYETATPRTLTVNGGVVIAAGAILRSASTGTVTTHVLAVGGSLTNSGTLDLSTNGNTAGADLRFVGAGSATFDGTGTTDLRVLGLFKGGIDDQVDLTLPFTVRGAAGSDPAGFFTTPFTGTLKLSGSSAYASNVFLLAGYTIPATGRFWLNNASFTVLGQPGSSTLTGQLRVTSGTYNVGTATDESISLSSLSRLTIEGGAINVAGRLAVSNAGNAVTYRQTGGTVTLPTAGNTSTTFASFDLGTSSSSAFTMTGGSIVFRLAGTGASGPRDYRVGVGGGTYRLAGGTLQFGDGSSGAAKTFRMTATAANVATVFPNLSINNASAAHTVQLATGPVLGLGATLAAGTTLNLSGFAASFQGSLVNGGTVIGTTAGSRLVFAGSAAQTWSGSGTVTAPLDGLRLDNAAGLTLTCNPFTTLRVELVRGTLVNSNRVTLGNGGTTSGITQIGTSGALSPGGSYDVSPVFNAGTGGAQVLYLDESTPRITGVEIPGSRSLSALTIGNPSGVTLSGGALSVSTSLSLTSGRFHTTAANVLTLGVGVTSPPSGSAGSYVNGPLAVQVNSASNVTRTFAIGSPTAWRPVVLSSFHSGGILRTYQAEVVDASTGGTPIAPLTSLNPTRYFRIQNTAGVFSTTLATVQLSYGTGDVVPNVATARVAQSATSGGSYTSRGGGSTASPTTGIVSDSPINGGDDYFVLGDATPPVAPTNDNCSGATSIPGSGPFPYVTSQVDVAAATTTGDPAFCAAASHTAWYTFTPSTTATYTITTCQAAAPGTTATDTVLGVFTAGSCGGPFTTTACNDNDAICAGGTSRSTVTAPLLAGTTYYVVVGTAGSSTPSPSKVQLSVSRLLPPANDSCAAPVSLAVNVPVDGTTAGALDDYELSGSTCFTSQGQIGNTASTAAGKDVVYAFTAPTAGKYSLRVSGYEAGNAVLYTSSSCPASTYPTPKVVTTCVSAANRTAAPAEEVMCQTLSAGQTLYALVDESAAAGAAFTIEATACDQESGANDTPGAANVLACGKEGSIGLTDWDFFTLGSPGSGWRAFAMIDAIASSVADTELRLTDSANVWEFDDDDADAAFGSLSAASLISGGVLPAGATYLAVAGWQDVTAVEPYRLYTVLQPPIASATVESEPNDVPASANSAGNDYFQGSLASTSDTDLYAFAASAGDLVFLGLDCDANRDGTAANGLLALLGTDGASVLESVNGSTNGQTPSPTPGVGLTATTPSYAGEGLVYRIRSAGTYYARVTGFPGAGPQGQDYLLSISRNCMTPSANLSVSQSASGDPIATGATVTYTVTVTNAGPNAANNAKLTDNVPTGMAFVSVTPPAGWSCGAPSGGQYTCTTASLAPSAPAVFTIVDRASYCTGSHPATHTVTVSSDSPDPSPAGNTSNLVTNIVDPGTCSDNNVCTSGDTCVGGSCVGGPPPACSDGNACTADSCNPVTGLCEHATITCNDGNACTDDTCLPASGCVFTNDNSNACSDDDLCTTSDHCSSGSCIGTAVDCSDGNACTTDTCTVATGACAHTNLTTSCNDGSLCTTGDQCGPRFGEGFDGVTPPALPAGWTTAVVTGQAGDAAFESTGTFSATPPQAAYTDTPEHVTDKVLVWPSVGVTTATARLSFQHRYALEEGFDGTVLEISIGGGAFADIVTAGGSFGSGGYDGTIASDQGSPIAGRAAWTGSSSGFVAVTVNLPASAAGQAVVVRWRVASDTLIGLAGYWLDAIELTEPGGAYTCGGTAVSCDDGSVCTVDSCSPATGCAHVPGNSGTECRASSGSPCDPAEQCDGTNPACPPDAFGASSAVGNTVRVSHVGPTATVSWSGETAAGPFNVYRGSRPKLYDHTCWMSNLPGTSVVDGDALSVGDWRYYLVSRDAPPCFESSLGQASNGTERPNATPCP